MDNGALGVEMKVAKKVLRKKYNEVSKHRNALVHSTFDGRVSVEDVTKALEAAKWIDVEFWPK